MKERVKFTETPYLLVIELNPGTKTYVKFFLLLSAIFIIGPPIYSEYGNGSGWAFQAGGMLLLGIIFIALYLLASHTFLKRAFRKEKIEVTKEEILVIDHLPFWKKVNRFGVDEVEHIGSPGYQKFTPHPLATGSFDYLGWNTAEKEIQYLIEDGTMEIVTAQKRLRFGINIPSWEAEEIIERIKAFTGKDFGNQSLYKYDSLDDLSSSIQEETEPTD